MIKPITILIAVALSGCTNKEIELKEYDDTKSTTITFLNLSQNATAYPSVFEDDYDCYASKVARPEPPHRSKKIPIDTANRRFYTVLLGFSDLQYDVIKDCQAIYSFSVEKSKIYKVLMSTNEKVCTFSIRQKSKYLDDLDWQPVETYKRAKETPMWDGYGPWCAPDEKFKNSSSLLQPRGI